MESMITITMTPYEAHLLCEGFKLGRDDLIYNKTKKGVNNSSMLHAIKGVENGLPE